MPSAYTNIAKPTDATYSNISKSSVEFPQYGVAIYGTSKYGRQSNYTSISKPTDDTYTNITKPTT